MQEFLLPAMLTLGHHTPEALEVLTAITTAELEHLVLGRGMGLGNRAATSGPSESQAEGPLQTDVLYQNLGGGGDLTCQSKTSGLPLKRLWQ